MSLIREMHVEPPKVIHIEAWGDDFLVQFFEVESVSKAQELFDVTIESLRGGIVTLQVDTPSYSYFRTTRDGVFLYLIKVDNVIIYGTANEPDKEELIELLSLLGEIRNGESKV